MIYKVIFAVAETTGILKVEDIGDSWVWSFMDDEGSVVVNSTHRFATEHEALEDAKRLGIDGELHATVSNMVNNNSIHDEIFRTCTAMGYNEKQIRNILRALESTRTAPDDTDEHKTMFVITLLIIGILIALIVLS